MGTKGANPSVPPLIVQVGVMVPNLPLDLRAKISVIYKLVPIGYDGYLWFEN
jgi:hypothetical protein